MGTMRIDKTNSLCPSRSDIEYRRECRGVHKKVHDSPLSTRLHGLFNIWELQLTVLQIVCLFVEKVSFGSFNAGVNLQSGFSRWMFIKAMILSLGYN